MICINISQILGPIGRLPKEMADRSIVWYLLEHTLEGLIVGWE